MTDELTPVRCGCGGEAKTILYESYGLPPVYLTHCLVCGMSTRAFDTKAEAITAWNRAMGVKDRCCNTCDSYEAGRYCLLWSIFCPSDHWCKDWSGNE